MPRMLKERPGDDPTRCWPLRKLGSRVSNHTTAPASAGATG